jgi:hypothetical protein
MKAEKEKKAIKIENKNKNMVSLLRKKLSQTSQ